MKSAASRRLHDERSLDQDIECDLRAELDIGESLVARTSADIVDTDVAPRGEAPAQFDPIGESGTRSEKGRDGARVFETEAGVGHRLPWSAD